MITLCLMEHLDRMINFSIQNDTLKFLPVTRQVLSFREEVYSAASNFKNQKNLAVALSGGKDSEIIASTLIDLGIEFVPVFVRFKDQKNIHDYKYVKRFCNFKQLNLIEIELDIIAFCVNTIDDYIAQGYESKNIFRYLQLFILEKTKELGLQCIIGSPDYRFSKINDDINVVIPRCIQTPLRWCEHHQVDHCPYFYWSTPELYASYLQNDLIKFILNDKGYHRNFLDAYMPEKELVYRKYFPEIDNRIKTSGFELISGFRFAKEKLLSDQFGGIGNYTLSLSQIKNQLDI